MPDPIIITGPPRSGTTMLAKIASRLGYFMGFNTNNALEDWFFINTTEHIMHQIDVTWDRPVRGDQKWEPPVDRVVDELVGSTALSYEMMWGFKEPRYLIVEDVYERVWDRLDIKPTVIYIDRHPMDIANSLFKRENKKPDQLTNGGEEENRHLDSGVLETFPRKSARLTNFEGAYKYAQEMRSLLPSGECIKYEEFVRNPVQEVLWSNIGPSSITEGQEKAIRDFVTKDRAFAFRGNDNLIDFWKSTGDKYESGD